MVRRRARLLRAWRERGRIGECVCNAPTDMARAERLGAAGGTAIAVGGGQCGSLFHRIRHARPRRARPMHQPLSRGHIARASPWRAGLSTSACSCAWLARVAPAHDAYITPHSTCGCVRRLDTHGGRLDVQEVAIGPLFALSQAWLRTHTPMVAPRAQRCQQQLTVEALAGSAKIPTWLRLAHGGADESHAVAHADATRKRDYG